MRSRRLIAGAVAAVALLGVGPASAQAALLDGNCPGPANDELTSGPGDQREAQTFVALHTGTAVRGQMEIDKLGNGGDWVMQVLGADSGTGSPINGILGAGAVPDSSVPAGHSTLSVNFSSPAPVVAGHLYALVLLHDARYGTPDRNNASCPGDEWNSGPAPGVWSGPYGFDWVYSVFVNPPNDFTIGKVKGTKVSLTLPGPGSLDVAKSKRVMGRHTPFHAGGAVTLRVHLKKTGKAIFRRGGKIKTSLTFTPDGGDPNTLPLKLKRK